MPTSFRPLKVADREREVHPKLQEFVRLFQESEAKFRSYALKLCHSSVGDADDLLQEAWLKAVKSFESFDGENFWAWFSTIMHNAFIDQARIQNKERIHVLPTGVLNTEDDLLETLSDPLNDEEKESELLPYAKTAVEKLSPEDREVFEVFGNKERIEDYKIRHGIGKRTFLSRMRIVREKLRYEVQRLMKW